MAGSSTPGREAHDLAAGVPVPKYQVGRVRVAGPQRI